MNALFICLPIVFLIASVALSIRAVKHGMKKHRAVVMQIAAFAAVCLIAIAVPTAVSASSGQPAANNTTTTSTTAPSNDSSKGMGMLAIALACGISSIGGGIAVATAAPAAIGATGEDPKVFGKALIFVALGEGIAIYGLLVAILMLQKI